MASITCRNGETFPNSHRHGSVAEVRQCQGAPSSWKPAPEPATASKDSFSDRDGNWVPSGRQERRDSRNVYLAPNAVPAQLAAFNRDGRVMPGTAHPDNLAKSTDPTPEITAKLASEFRARYVDPELEAKVPDGRYAITVDGVTRFFRVRKVTKGQYAGRTFVDRQAGDEEFPVRFSGERTKILIAIAKDVKASAIRYGRELGVCSQCGRTLTNPDSIEAGIGPVCLSRLG